MDAMASPWLEALLRLFFPSRCALCRTLLTLEEALLCSGCRLSLEEHGFAPEDRKIAHPHAYLDLALAAFPYEACVQQLITELKFRRKPWLVRAFHPAIAETLGDGRLGRYDLVLPIPSGLRTRIRRQYNPPELLAREAGRILAAPVTPELIQKKRNVASQIGLAPEERLANLYGAFKIRHFKSIRGKSILLVDDVFTTGATADEAARVLKKYGARKVDIFVLAHAQFKS